MRSLIYLSLFACVLGTSVRSEAQVSEGDTRLYLDTGLFAWARETIEADSRSDIETTIIAFGPAMGGGIGIAHAFGRRFVPGVYTSFVRTNVEAEAGSNDAERAETRLELRPNVEIPIALTGSLIPYAQLGFSYVFSKSDPEGGDSRKDHGVGPALGLGMHVFAARAASFDLGLTFRPLFLFGDTKDAIEDSGADDVKMRSYSLLLTIGGSFWL